MFLHLTRQSMYISEFNVPGTKDTGGGKVLSYFNENILTNFYYVYLYFINNVIFFIMTSFHYSGNLFF